MMNIAVRSDDRYVTVDGLNIRYLEEGRGVPALLLHGASLGSSADVFRRNLKALGANGIRAIAFDLPGFGKSDATDDLSAGYKKKVVLKPWTRFALDRAALIAHSASGNAAMGIALEHPDRVSHLMILGTGSLRRRSKPAVPPSAAAKARQARWKSAWSSRSLVEDTRALLDANLFHRELITDDELQPAIRTASAPASSNSRRGTPQPARRRRCGKLTPLWQRFEELKMPLLMIYGREDRGRAAERRNPQAALPEHQPARRRRLQAPGAGTPPICSTSSRCHS
jgi:4,5:9,10-diseco-3-hydroxy-5,9,17-trioxoandrosta-1(10),2-diene-4-oate hydrolase